MSWQESLQGVVQDGQVWRDLWIGGERFALVVQTQHGDAVATTVVHRQEFGRRIGGARFRGWISGGAPADQGVAEAADLARTMTEKCAAAMIGADGQKSVIFCPDERLEDEPWKAAVLAEHIRVVAEIDPGVIFGPDMENPESVLDRIAGDPALRDHVTGLSAASEGLSIDAQGYTAEGVVIGIEEALGDGATGTRVSIQGFGAVGARAAARLHAIGARVVGVSNRLGAFRAIGHDPLDVPTLLQVWEEGGDEAVVRHARAHPDQIYVADDPDALLDWPAELFLPAATAKVLAMPHELEAIRTTENIRVRDVTAFWAATGVRLVAEGANCPLTDAAEAYLQERGVIVLPDYIVNCGGLIGCWDEWVARTTAPPSSPIDLEALDRAARAHIRQTVSSNAGRLLRTSGPARLAALQIVDRNRRLLLGRAGN
jgi:glutamate dehydrogenase (NAD(P)+)